MLLRHDRPEQAWHWMQRVLRTGSRSTEEYFLGAVCLYQGLGRMREATALFARANEREVAQAEEGAAMIRSAFLFLPVVLLPVARGVDSRPHLASVLQEGRKSTNIHAGSGVIRGIPV